MSVPGPQQPQPPAGGQLATAPPPAPSQQEFKSPYLHTAALICTPVAFLGLVLPPRRLDFRAVVLGGTAVWGVSQLKYDYTGSSFMHTFFNEKKTSSGGSIFSSELPSGRAAEVQRRIKEEKARRERTRELLASGVSEEDARRVQELERRKREAAGPGDEGDKGALEALWMGDADKDWKEKRAKKEQEALQEGGEGIWGLITDQVSEVFTRGERKAQEEKAKSTGKSDEKKPS